MMGKKFERCVKSVKKAQTKRYGEQKYNPYAVCTKSVGRLNAKKKHGFRVFGKIPSDPLGSMFVFESASKSGAKQLARKKYNVKPIWDVFKLW